MDLLSTNRMKKLAGLLKEAVERPEDYKELSNWIEKELSQSVRDSLLEIAIKTGPEAAAYELKKLDPDALSLWTEEELTEYFDETFLKEKELSDWGSVEDIQQRKGDEQRIVQLAKSIIAKLENLGDYDNLDRAVELLQAMQSTYM